VDLRQQSFLNVNPFSSYVNSFEQYVNPSSVLLICDFQSCVDMELDHRVDLA